MPKNQEYEGSDSSEDLVSSIIEKSSKPPKYEVD